MNKIELFFVALLITGIAVFVQAADYNPNTGTKTDQAKKDPPQIGAAPFIGQTPEEVRQEAAAAAAAQNQNEPAPGGASATTAASGTGANNKSNSNAANNSITRTNNTNKNTNTNSSINQGQGSQSNNQAPAEGDIIRGY